MKKNWWPNRLSRAIWHIDQSQEIQPPGITFFCCMQQDAPSGGDTLACSLTEAYNRLSPKMQEFLCGLKALHSSKAQAAAAARVGGANRKEGIDTMHPLIVESPVSPVFIFRIRSEVLAVLMSAVRPVDRREITLL